MPEHVPSQYDVSTHAASVSELFASTIQSSHDLESLDDALDEEEIERNIAEINAAIRRSAARKS